MADVKITTEIHGKTKEARAFELREQLKPLVDELHKLLQTGKATSFHGIADTATKNWGGGILFEMTALAHIKVSYEEHEKAGITNN